MSETFRRRSPRTVLLRPARESPRTDERLLEILLRIADSLNDIATDMDRQTRIMEQIHMSRSGPDATENKGPLPLPYITRDHLELSTRPHTALEGCDILRTDPRRIKNFGKRSFAETIRELIAHGVNPAAINRSTFWLNAPRPWREFWESEAESKVCTDAKATR
jgi:hypothetical protein